MSRVADFVMVPTLLGVAFSPLVASGQCYECLDIDDMDIHACYTLSETAGQQGYLQCVGRDQHLGGENYTACLLSFVGDCGGGDGFTFVAPDGAMVYTRVVVAPVTSGDRFGACRGTLIERQFTGRHAELLRRKARAIRI